MAYQEIDWVLLVKEVQSNKEDAVTKLYFYIKNGAEFKFRKETTKESLEDKVHDIFILILTAIKNDSIRQPECLPEFIKSLIFNQYLVNIRHLSKTRKLFVELEEWSPFLKSNHNTETQLYLDQKENLLKTTVGKALSKLNKKDKNILKSFYFNDHTIPQIGSQLCLSSRQVVNCKSKAQEKVRKYLSKNLNKLESVAINCKNTVEQ